jgi:predicted CopG family antitoxin
MSKPAKLSDEAYAALRAHRKRSSDTLSQVILRFVPPPIRTFGDLEKHLEKLDAPLQVDWEAMEKVRQRKEKFRRVD